MIFLREKRSHQSFCNPLIENPPFVDLASTYLTADYWHSWELDQDAVARILKRAGFNSTLYPYVIDIGAGTGGFSRWIADFFGHSAASITCIENKQYSLNRIPEANWLYLDAEVMGKALINNPHVEFPQSIRDLHERYDFAMISALGSIDPEPFIETARFFLKKNGLLYIYPYTIESSKRWNPVRKWGEELDFLYTKK